MELGGQTPGADRRLWKRRLGLGPFTQTQKGPLRSLTASAPPLQGLGSWSRATTRDLTTSSPEWRPAISPMGSPQNHTEATLPKRHAIKTTHFLDERCLGFACLFYKRMGAGFPQGSEDR